MSTQIQTEPQVVGKFAVMRHSRGFRRMHFTALHDTREQAQAEAQRLFVSKLDADPPGCHGFYIVQILSRVGVFDGKLERG